MSWLLNVIYGGLLAVLSPWLVWTAWRRGKYRQGWRAKLWGDVPSRPDGGMCVWLHAVSLGEVNLLATLIAEISSRRPDVHCYITTTTLTGYQAACRRYPHCTISYCPLDFSWAVRRALRRIRPQLLVLAELELWPNLIRTARACGAAVAVVNGRLSPHSYRGYRRLGPLIRQLLWKIDLIAVQTDEYAARFRSLGAPAERLMVTGSLKFDGAPSDRGNSATRELARLAAVSSDDVIWVAGSTFPPEEQLLISVFQRLAPAYPNLRLFLVPRHPERFDEVADLLRHAGLSFARRSQLASGGTTARVLLIDSVGELSAWWGLAQVGFVGGSLGKRGGQNMIEPAGFGVSICFGPQTENFRDVVQAMLQADAAQVVTDAGTLESFVRDCLDQPTLADQRGRRAQALVQQSLGATGRTADALVVLLPPARPEPSACQQRRSA